MAHGRSYFEIFLIRLWDFRMSKIPKIVTIWESRAKQNLINFGEKFVLNYPAVLLLKFLHGYAPITLWPVLCGSTRSIAHCVYDPYGLQSRSTQRNFFKIYAKVQVIYSCVFFDCPNPPPALSQIAPVDDTNDRQVYIFMLDKILILHVIGQRCFRRLSKFLKFIIAVWIDNNNL